MTQAIDLNDVQKSGLAIQIIYRLLVLIPVADCSEAVHVCDDLTDEEKELCSATSYFDLIIENLLNRLFSILDILAESPQNNRQNLTGNSEKNDEEVMIQKGVLSIMHFLLKQCSMEIYEVGMVLRKIWGLLKGNESTLI